MIASNCGVRLRISRFTHSPNTNTVSTSTPVFFRVFVVVCLVFVWPPCDDSIRLVAYLRLWRCGCADLSLVCTRSAIWSPAQNDVFASVSGDYTLKIWNSTEPHARLTVQAHEYEILAVDWNKCVRSLVLRCVSCLSFAFLRRSLANVMVWLIGD